MLANAGRGQPRGSKNRKNLLRETRMAGTDERMEKEKAVEAAKVCNKVELDDARTTGDEGSEV